MTTVSVKNGSDIVVLICLRLRELRLFPSVSEKNKLFLNVSFNLLSLLSEYIESHSL